MKLKRKLICQQEEVVQEGAIETEITRLKPIQLKKRRNNNRYKYIWRRADKQYAYHAEVFKTKVLNKGIKKLKLLKNEPNEIHVEISKNAYLALLIKRKKRCITKKDWENKPREFSNEILLSDWDNPDLVWAKLREDWPEWQAAIKAEIYQLVKDVKQEKPFAMASFDRFLF